VGQFAGTRRLLDYESWHVHYTPQRQAVQDAIVAEFLEAGVRSDTPWLVFTAGPMGAGEDMSHLLRGRGRALAAAQ